MQTKDIHFWEHAPSIGWVSYLWRKIMGQPTNPVILPVNPIMLPVSMDTDILPMKPENATEYADFLEKYFYTHSIIPTTLKLPHAHLEKNLTIKNWIGVEKRDPITHALIGIVISKGAGVLGRESCGFVDYLCVHPTYRKTGIASQLLRSLYTSCVSTDYRYVQFFVKEGGFSLLPSLSTETIIAKKPCVNEHYSVEIKKMDRESWLSSKKKMDPTAIILQNYRQDVESELYVATYGASVVVFKPNYEFEYGQLQGSASIIDWHGNAEDNEIIVNNISYDYVYASSKFPHVASIFWKTVGQQSTYAFHLDPGCPFERAVFSPLTA